MNQIAHYTWRNIQVWVFLSFYFLCQFVSYWIFLTIHKCVWCSFERSVCHTFLTFRAYKSQKLIVRMLQHKISHCLFSIFFSCPLITMMIEIVSHRHSSINRKPRLITPNGVTLQHQPQWIFIFNYLFPNWHSRKLDKPDLTHSYIVLKRLQWVFILPLDKRLKPLDIEHQKCK